MATRPAPDEKLKILREAVADPSRPHPPDDSLREMFAGWAERFTVWHVRLLALLDDPGAWFAARNRPFPAPSVGSLSGLVTDAFPQLRGHRDFYDLVAKDLWLAGLVNTDGLHTTMSGSGVAASRTTELGKRFLRFVTESGSDR